MPSVTTHHSYGSRVGNSFKAIFWGIVLVIISIILLVWNENNYLQQKKALQEGAAVVQEAVADQINPELDQKEIHVSGQTASTAEALTDNEFWVTVDDLKLKRTVEMYQWHEKSEEHCTDNVWWSEDCTTTYTYNKQWDEDAISSSSFYESQGHENPATREYTSASKEKTPITLGAYTLTDTFVSQLTNYKPVNLAEQNITTPDKYKLIADRGDSVEDNNNNYLYWSADNATKFHVTSDYIYIWSDPTSPAIGDLKISFSSVKEGTVSIVWKQAGNELSSYTVSNGRSIALLDEGNVSAADMFLAAQKENKMITRILRFLWLILMFVWFSSMLKFVETLAKVIPFLANIIWVWTSIIALCLTIVIGFLTIGIAWLAVRPVIGICCLVVAAGWIILLIRSKKPKIGANPEVIEAAPEAPESK